MLFIVLFFFKSQNVVILNFLKLFLLYFQYRDPSFKCLEFHFDWDLLFFVFLGVFKFLVESLGF